MRRDVDEIRASFTRIIRKVNDQYVDVDAGLSAQESYARWDDTDPKPLLSRELNYDYDIRDHPLYVPPELRVDFGVKQTAVGQPEWPGTWPGVNERSS
jgi:hypothetical protein